MIIKLEEKKPFAAIACPYCSAMTDLCRVTCDNCGKVIK